MTNELHNRIVAELVADDGRYTHARMPGSLRDLLSLVIVELTRLRELVSELEDTIALDKADAYIAHSYGRDAEAVRVAQEIRSRRGEDWRGAR